MTTLSPTTLKRPVVRYIKMRNGVVYGYTVEAFHRSNLCVYIRLTGDRTVPYDGWPWRKTRAEAEQDEPFDDRGLLHKKFQGA